MFIFTSFKPKPLGTRSCVGVTLLQCNIFLSVMILLPFYFGIIVYNMLRKQSEKNAMINKTIIPLPPPPPKKRRKKRKEFGHLKYSTDLSNSTCPLQKYVSETIRCTLVFFELQRLYTTPSELYLEQCNEYSFLKLCTAKSL